VRHRWFFDRGALLRDRKNFRVRVVAGVGNGIDLEVAQAVRARPGVHHTRGGR